MADNIDKGLYQAPMGLDQDPQNPETSALSIEIENPDSVTLDDGSIYVEYINYMHISNSQTSKNNALNGIVGGTCMHPAHLLSVSRTIIFYGLFHIMVCFRFSSGMLLF